MNHIEIKSESTRRTFLKQTTISIAGAIVAPTILSSCIKGANDRVQIAHIGVGRRGLVELVQYFLPLANSRSIAVCDVFKSKRETVAQKVNDYYKNKKINSPECLSYLDYLEILQRDDIDAVSIVTPDHWHLPIAINAARAGKHIMLAKPLGLSVDDYVTLKEEAKKNNIVFQYGTQQRSYGHFKLLRSMILDGAIGKIERVEAWAPEPDRPPVYYEETPIPKDLDYDRWLGPAPLAPYHPGRIFPGAYFIYDYCLGFISCWGAHPLDIMIYMMPELIKQSFNCTATGTFWDKHTIFNTVYSWDVDLEYEKGLSVKFMSNKIAAPIVRKYRNTFESNGTTFWGSKGWLSVGRGTIESNIKEILPRFNDFKRHEKWGFVDSNLHGQRFVDTILGKEKEIAPLSEAIASDTVSHIGEISIRTGRKIEWNPEKMKIIKDDEADKLYHRVGRAPYSQIN